MTIVRFNSFREIFPSYATTSLVLLVGMAATAVGSVFVQRARMNRTREFYETRLAGAVERITDLEQRLEQAEARVCEMDSKEAGYKRTVALLRGQLRQMTEVSKAMTSLSGSSPHTQVAVEVFPEQPPLRVEEASAPNPDRLLRVAFSIQQLNSSISFSEVRALLSESDRLRDMRLVGKLSRRETDPALAKSIVVVETALGGIGTYLKFSYKKDRDLQLGSGNAKDVISGIDFYTGEKVAIARIKPGGIGIGREVVLLQEREGNLRFVRLRGTCRARTGKQYLVMDHYPATLRSALGQPRDAMQNYLWALQIVEAVEELHLKGLAHCDLKSQNILLSLEGQCVLGDLGLTRPDDHPDIWMVGTPSYYSPTQAEAKLAGNGVVLGRPADIWALGCIFIKMFSSPTRGISWSRCTDWSDPTQVRELFGRIAHLTYAQIQEEIAHVSPEVQPLLEVMLHIAPARRCDIKYVREFLARLLSS